MINKLKGIIHAILVKFRARNMKYMFKNCDTLKELDLKVFDTSNITNMRGMFLYCNTLEKLDLKGFNTASMLNVKSEKII